MFTCFKVEYMKQHFEDMFINLGFQVENEYFLVHDCMYDFHDSMFVNIDGVSDRQVQNNALIAALSQMSLFIGFRGYIALSEADFLLMEQFKF